MKQILNFLVVLVLCMTALSAVAETNNASEIANQSLANKWFNQIEYPIINSVALGEEAAKWQQQKSHSLSAQQQALGELYWTEFQIQKQQRYLASLKNDVMQLNQDIATVNKLKTQLEPQLEIWYAQIERLIFNDLPFDFEERKRRLSFLRSAMDDHDLSIAERFKRLMEIITIEVAYGYGQQVTHDVISVEHKPLQVNLLRLGRLTWFYITPDQQHQGWFDQTSRTWQPLSIDQRGDLDLAMAITSNKKIAEIVNLPIVGSK